jgi:hypothetical protein
MKKETEIKKYWPDEVMALWKERKIEKIIPVSMLKGSMKGLKESVHYRGFQRIIYVLTNEEHSMEKDFKIYQLALLAMHNLVDLDAEEDYIHNIMNS